MPVIAASPNAGVTVVDLFHEPLKSADYISQEQKQEQQEQQHHEVFNDPLLRRG